MSKLRVLLADDHSLVRSGMRAMIDTLPDMEVVGEAADGAAAVREAALTRPDVVVMDVSMPVMNGVEATSELRRRWPDVRVIALTAHEDRGYLQQMLAAGAIGFVLKRAAAENLIRAIRDAAAGRAYVDASVAGPAITAQDGPGEPLTDDALSEREVDILRLVAEGLSNNEVAARLHLDLATVESGRLAAMTKLGVKSRVGIVRYALHKGWLTGA